MQITLYTHFFRSTVFQLWFYKQRATSSITVEKISMTKGYLKTRVPEQRNFKTAFHICLTRNIEYNQLETAHYFESNWNRTLFWVKLKQDIILSETGNPAFTGKIFLNSLFYFWVWRVTRAIYISISIYMYTFSIEMTRLEYLKYKKLEVLEIITFFLSASSLSPPPRLPGGGLSPTTLFSLSFRYFFARGYEES